MNGKENIETRVRVLIFSQRLSTIIGHISNATIIISEKDKTTGVIKNNGRQVKKGGADWYYTAR